MLCSASLFLCYWPKKRLIPDIDTIIITSAVDAGHDTWSRGYQLAWASIILFLVVAAICYALLTDVKQSMTEKVESTIEHDGRRQWYECRNLADVSTVTHWHRYIDIMLERILFYEGTSS